MINEVTASPSWIENSDWGCNTPVVACRGPLFGTNTHVHWTSQDLLLTGFAWAICLKKNWTTCHIVYFNDMIYGGLLDQNLSQKQQLPLQEGISLLDLVHDAVVLGQLKHPAN